MKRKGQQVRLGSMYLLDQAIRESGQFQHIAPRQQKFLGSRIFFQQLKSYKRDSISANSEDEKSMGIVSFMEASQLWLTIPSVPFGTARPIEYARSTSSFGSGGNSH